MAQAESAPYDPARYRKERAHRLAYQRTHYAANRERIMARNNTAYHAHKHDEIPPFPDRLSAAPHVWHCELMQPITHLPHVCVCCGVRLFVKEDIPHG